jgi:antirestriction protein ArdC
MAGTRGTGSQGERATLVVFWKFANNTADSQDGEEHASNTGSRLLFTRGYSVFNAAQVDGYTAKPDADMPIEQRIETAEQLQTLPHSTCHANSVFFIK